MRVFFRAGLPASLFFLSLSAWAWPPTYGPEWEFGSRDLWHLPDKTNWSKFKEMKSVFPGAKEREAIERFRDTVLKKCPECTSEKIPDGKFESIGVSSYRIHFPDGYRIEVTPDPWVIEITAKPQTLEELRSNSARIQSIVFDTAREIGLSPTGHDIPVSRAAGHFNIGVRSAWGDNALDFLRFAADYSNHPELAMGGLGHDFLNAPPLARLTPEARANFQQLLRDSFAQHSLTYRELFVAMAEHVYKLTPVLSAGPIHYQALSIESLPEINLWHPSSDQPTELRALRMQENAEEFVRLAELFELRIAFLKKSKDVPVLVDRSIGSFSKKEHVSRFYVYVTEAGGNFSRFRKLLMPELAGVDPDPFITGRALWSDANTLSEARTHLPFIQTSEWMRQHFRKMMLHPSFQPTHARALVIELLALAQNPRTPSASSAPIFSFIDEIVAKSGRPLPSALSHTLQIAKNAMQIKAVAEASRTYVDLNKVPKKALACAWNQIKAILGR